MKKIKLDIGLLLIGGFVLIGLILLITGAIGAPDSAFRIDADSNSQVTVVTAADTALKSINFNELSQWIGFLAFAVYVFISERQRVVESHTNSFRFAEEDSRPLLWKWIHLNGTMSYGMALIIPFLFFMVVFLLSGENPMAYEWVGPWGGFALIGTLLGWIYLTWYVKRVRSVSL